MRRLLYITLVLSAVVLQGCRKKEEIKPLQADQFVKFYGKLDESQPAGFVELSDGWLIAGTFKNESGTNDIFTVRTDLYGNTLWEQQYHIYNSQTALAVEKAPSGFIIVGNAEVATDIVSMLALKIDDAGNVEWSGDFGSGGDNQSAADVVSASNGDFLLVGYDERFLVSPFGSNAGEKIGYYVSLSSTGSFNYESWCGGTGYPSELTAAIEVSQGYLMVGTTFALTASGTAANGAFSSIFAWGSPLIGGPNWFGDAFGTDGSSDIAHDLVEITTNKIVVVGAASGHTGSIGGVDGNVLQVSIVGTTAQLDWQKYHGTASDDELTSVNIANGNLIATGYTTTVANAEEQYLIEMGSSGNENWSTTFGNTGQDFGYQVKSHSAGGYVFQGVTELDGASTVTLIRTDAAGELNNLSQ